MGSWLSAARPQPDQNEQKMPSDRHIEAVSFDISPQQATTTITTQTSSLTSPPLIPSLRVSSDTLDLSGNPPFTAFIDWKLSGTRPIYALLGLRCRRACGIMLRDPETNRRKGPNGDPPTNGCDESPADKPGDIYGIKDPALLRLGPGDICRQSYTWIVDERVGFIDPHRADTHWLETDSIYNMDVGGNHCHWIYQDELPLHESGSLHAEVSDDVLERLLEKMPINYVKTETQLQIRTVGNHPAQRGLVDHGIMTYEFIPYQE